MQKKASILIVEDDMIIAANISLQLNNLGYEVLGIVTRGEEALDFVKKNVPDILLLDINLKGKMDGIETAKQIEKIKAIPVIYLTANADEATFNKAKITKPKAFITKPFNKLNLERTIALVADQCIAQVLDTVEPTPDLDILNDRIFIRHKGQMVKLLFDAIYYIVADRNYCCLKTESGSYVLSCPLKEMHERLPSSHFIRVHRSYIVNILKLNLIADDHLVINKKAIPLSKTYKADLYNRIHTI